MKRPRIKCALCEKRRVPPKGIQQAINIIGKRVSGQINYIIYHPICSQCNGEIWNLLSKCLRDKI